jgi:hypothetical protein
MIIEIINVFSFVAAALQLLAHSQSLFEFNVLKTSKPYKLTAATLLIMYQMPVA